MARTVTSSPWTAEDHALMLAWRTYLAGIHEPCEHPIATAFHPDNEGWFKAVEEVTCWACTAAAGKNDDGTTRPHTIPIVIDTRDYVETPLPPRRPLKS